MAKFDVVVIGGGHNGLVAAAYLAKAGRAVCVFERRGVLGGCATSEEVWPGYAVSPAAYVVSLLLPEIISDLKLRENGLEILRREPSSFTPTLDGRALVLGPDRSANAASIAQFSEWDAMRYPKYEDALSRVAESLEPAMMAEPSVWRMLRAGLSMGLDAPYALRLMVGRATKLLDGWFESDVLKATLATDAIIGADAPPSSWGSAYVLLHHVMGSAGGERGVWGYIRGGMGGLARALERTCDQLGVVIRRDAPVDAINVHGGRATGVTLESGEVIDADVVTSSVDASRTMLGLVGVDRLPNGYAAAIRKIDYRSASAKVNLALDALPDFACRELPPEVAMRGTTHLCEDVGYIERAYADAVAGGMSREPVVEITIPSTVDDTITPPGKHVMGIFVQYVPHGFTDHDVVLDRVLRVIERYDSGFRKRVLHSQVLLPTDLEQRYGLTGGNIFQGAMSLDQIGPWRTKCRTPIDGLYLCGAAIHPGGGIMGACGRNAARTILRQTSRPA